EVGRVCAKSVAGTGQGGPQPDVVRGIDGGLPPMLNDDRDVRAVEMRYYVGAYGARGRDGLEPNVAHDPAVVPPIGKAPRNDVVAGAPHGIVDAYDDVVVRAGHQRARGIERERRIAALVVA